MPGYLITPIAEASSIPVVPSGNITASNLQDALQQLDTNKAETTAVSASVSSLDSDITSAEQQISSVEGVALLGL